MRPVGTRFSAILTRRVSSVGPQKERVPFFARRRPRNITVWRNGNPVKMGFKSLSKIFFLELNIFIV